MVLIPLDSLSMMSRENIDGLLHEKEEKKLFCTFSGSMIH